jgi:hypothetical protein
LVQSFFIRVMLVWKERAEISRPLSVMSVVALSQSIYEDVLVVGSARHQAKGYHTLSLDIADFWSLMLKKVAPRRCLSDSPRSLKDMAGDRGRVDAEVVWFGGFAALL